MNIETINRLGLHRINASAATMNNSSLNLLVEQLLNGDRNMVNYLAASAILEESGRNFSLQIRFPAWSLRYVLEGETATQSEPARYVEPRLRVSSQSDSSQHWIWRGVNGIALRARNFSLSTRTSGPLEEPARVAPKGVTSGLLPMLELPLTIKALRRMLNRVSKENNGLFCLASSGDTWSVYSSCPTEENRFRVTPTIYGTGDAGVRYDALYSMLFRKKEAVRGVYRDLPENSSITLRILENNFLAITRELG